MRLHILCLLLLSSCAFDPGEAIEDGDDVVDPDASIDDGYSEGTALGLARPPYGPYNRLSASGLYLDIGQKIIRDDVLAFEPEFELWSDRAAKSRWIWLPPGTRINTSNMGRWVVPVGTTVWKEFRNPNTGRRLETRVIQRLPNNASGAVFFMASFVWNRTQTEALRDRTLVSEPARDIPNGCSVCTNPPCGDIAGNCHVVPQAGLCNRCHGGEPYKLLGFSAVQLSHDGPGTTLSDLADLDLLTVPPPGGATYPVPGTNVERRAIGYLHANCGHCHDAGASQQNCHNLTGFSSRVLPGDDTVEETTVWNTAVDQELEYWLDDMAGNHTDPLITMRIAPGDPTMSAIWYRMSVREWGQLAPYDDHQQMPTLGTHEVDQAGLGAIETWIDSLD